MGPMSVPAWLWLAGSLAAATPTQATWPGWLEVAPVRPAELAVLAWQEIAQAQDLERSQNPEIAAALGQVNAAERFTTGLVYRNPRQGAHAGRWWFSGNEGDSLPKAGLRLVMPEQAPYRVRVELFCDEAAGTCEPLRQHLVGMPPPKPTQTSALQDWFRVVGTEPCQAGPVRMPAPPYSSAALRRQAAGVVRVQFFHDACGNVRHASLHQSSGHRELDEAAVRGVSEWRVRLPAGQQAAGFAQVPITFRLDAQFPDAPGDPPAND